MQDKLRIIGGQWRSRQISFYDAPGLRPTPVRVRETLFNWLQYDIPGSRCLDLYAGSGALGFEAASRGALSVVQVETNPDVCRALKENVAKLAATQINIVESDVFGYLTSAAEPYDIVFLDPPFAMNLTTPTCHYLETNGWLSRHAKIYVEAERKQNFLKELPKNWHLLKSKTAGEVGYHLLERK